MNHVGFTREELTEATAQQAKTPRKRTVFEPAATPPSKEEILAAIQSALEGTCGIYLDEARGIATEAVEKLYAERGL